MTEKELKKNYIRGIIKASNNNEELLVNEILKLCSKQYRLGLAQGKFDTTVEFQQRIDRAVELAYQYAHVDGGHHRIWTIDQMIRVLLGGNYEKWISDYEEGGKYLWDIGIAP